MRLNRQVCLWCDFGKIPWVHDHQPRNRGKSIEDSSPSEPPWTKKHSGHLEIDRSVGCSTSLPLSTCRKSSSILKNSQGVKKKEQFRWTKECWRAFEELRAFLGRLPLLTQPIHEEELYLYLAASIKTISLVLMREEKKVQMPVYYVSKVLKMSNWDISRLRRWPMRRSSR